MGEEIKKDPQGGGTGETPENHDETIKNLQTQVENLNKGIASYRDEAKEANETAKAAVEKLSEYEKLIEELKGKKTEDGVELSPEDEKKFAAWATKQGLASKKDLEAERERIASESAKNVATTAVNEFLEKHPEYDDDEKWKEVQNEFNLYKTPKDLASYRALLERVHKNLSGDKSGEKAKAEARAEIINKKRLSLGGGSQGGNAGNSDDEVTVENLQKKYPNLSKEQIAARLSEIKSLYPDKKK